MNPDTAIPVPKEPPPADPGVRELEDALLSLDRIRAGTLIREAFAGVAPVARDQSAGRRVPSRGSGMTIRETGNRGKGVRFETRVPYRVRGPSPPINPQRRGEGLNNFLIPGIPKMIPGENSGAR